jgi:CrcB protein
MTRNIILVFIGGGLGSVARYLMGRWVNTLHTLTFPFATLVINIIACFVLGFVVGLADDRQSISTASRLFWTVGFCGGFSTFSTFSNESLILFQTGLTLHLASYIIFSIVFCVGATMVGLLAANYF